MTEAVDVGLELKKLREKVEHLERVLAKLRREVYNGKGLS